jgi:sugar phosphate isomerase/epimerase
VTPPAGPRWVLWAGTVGYESPLEERVAVAAAAGYDMVSIGPPDVERAQVAGIAPRELGRRIRDSGLEIVMDPVMHWYGGVPRATSRFARFSFEESMAMCETVGVNAVSVIGQTSSDVDAAGMATHFAALCDRAAGFGAVVQLEFIPMTEIADLATAWAIVRAADRPNGGVLVDTWHFFRGNPDLALLASIPGDRIFSVQVDDAGPVGNDDLWQDTRHRLLPGDGQFDLDAVLGVLSRTGGLSYVGPEVLSPTLEAMPMLDAATLAGARTRAAIDRVCRS